MFKLLKHLATTKKNTNTKKSSHCKLKKSLNHNVSMFKEVFRSDDTIIFKHIDNVRLLKLKCCIFYANGMVNKELISNSIIKPVLLAGHDDAVEDISIIDILERSIITSSSIVRTSDLDEIAGSVLYGDTALLIDGIDEALIITTSGFEKRSINEPESEKVVRGPREGFVESILVNISLIRRKIKNPGLKFNFRELGVRTKTKICICYIDGIASEKIVKEVNTRLDKIEIDGILESGYIEELIKDSPLSPFSTTGNTERPDVVAGKLLEGRVAIICDGSPFVLTVPYLFIEHFQSNEDYYREFIFASFNRILRMLGFILSISIPAIYIAIVTFHQEVLQTPLLLSISAARNEIPFPSVVEALLMVFVFEVLREAGIRLPTPIGQAVSIVGALVLGEAAVTARFVSAPIVIVTALTGISSFLVPKIVGPVVIIRMILIILSSFLGLYGYIFGIIGMSIHLLSMRSFGVPYMQGIGTLNQIDIQDTAIRAPWWLMYYRPLLMYNQDSVRKSHSRSNGKG